MDKYVNSLKMMGVSGKDAVLFSDALSTYHLTISPSVRKANRDLMLSTVIMGKTVKEWFIKFDDESPKPPHWELQPTPIIKMMDFIQSHQFKLLVEILFQKYLEDTI